MAELQDFFPRLIVSIQDIDGPIVAAQLPPEPSPRPPDMEEGSTESPTDSSEQEEPEKCERVPLLPAGSTVLVETTDGYGERGVLKKPNRGGICVVKMATRVIVRPHRRLVRAAPPRFELGQVVQVRRMRSPELYVDVFVVKDCGDSIHYRVTKWEELKRRRKTGVAVIRRVRVPLRSRDGGGCDFVDYQAAMMLRAMAQA